jgi:hypothetical protein
VRRRGLRAARPVGADGHRLRGPQVQRVAGVPQTFALVVRCELRPLDHTGLTGIADQLGLVRSAVQWVRHQRCNVRATQVASSSSGSVRRCDSAIESSLRDGTILVPSGVWQPTCAFVLKPRRLCALKPSVPAGHSKMSFERPLTDISVSRRVLLGPRNWRRSLLQGWFSRLACHTAGHAGG